MRSPSEIDLSFDISGKAVKWLGGLLSTSTYVNMQFWAAVLVLGFCLTQLHVDRKFRWPAEPGRITIFGYYIGFQSGNAKLALRFADVGTVLDWCMTIVGRVGIAGQGVVAVFAIDDVMAHPVYPRPMVTWALVSIVLIQMRVLSAYVPREPRTLA